MATVVEYHFATVVYKCLRLVSWRTKFKLRGSALHVLLSVQLLLVVFNLAYSIFSEYPSCRLSYRCAIINSTLYSALSDSSLYKLANSDET